MIPLALFFILNITLVIRGSLWFHVNFRIFYSSLVENMGVLIGIVLKLYIAFGSIDILIILTVPIYELGLSFHFFVSSSVVFTSVTIFSDYKSFTSLELILFYSF